MIENQPPAPLLGVISLALPALALLIGFIVLSGSRNGDVARALGGGVLFAFSLAAVCVSGELAALAALWRGERMAWLAVLGIIINGAFLLPILRILLKAE